MACFVNLNACMLNQQPMCLLVWVYCMMQPFRRGDDEDLLQFSAAAADVIPPAVQSAVQSGQWHCSRLNKVRGVVSGAIVGAATGQHGHSSGM